MDGKGERPMPVKPKPDNESNRTEKLVFHGLSNTDPKTRLPYEAAGVRTSLIGTVMEAVNEGQGDFLWRWI